MTDAYRRPQAKLVLPPRRDLLFDQLPEASRAWLRDVAHAPVDPRRLVRDVGSGPILAIAVGVIPLALAVAMAFGFSILATDGVRFDRAPPWSDTELAVAAGACAAAGALIAWGIAVLRKTRRSLLGSFWYAHRAYLLACDDRRVTVYPLAMLTANEITGPAIDLAFGPEDVRLVFEEPAQAARFGGLLLRDASAARKAAEEDPELVDGADLVPSSLLLGRDRGRRGGLSPVPLAAAMVCGLLGRFALPVAHADLTERRDRAACRGYWSACDAYFARYPASAHRADVEAALVDQCRKWSEGCGVLVARFPDAARRAEVDDLFFGHCARGSWDCERYLRVLPNGAHRDEADDILFRAAKTPAALAAYREVLPNGRHAAESGGAVAARYDEAITRYRAHADPSASTGIDALVHLLGLVRETGRDLVYVRVTNAGPRDSDELPYDPGGHEAEVRSALAKAIEDAAGAGLVRFADVAPEAAPPATAPAAIEVRYVASRGPRAFKRQGSEVEIREIVYDWTVTFTWPVHPEQPPLVLSLRTDPGLQVQGMPFSVQKPSALLADAAFRRFSDGLTRALGMKPSR